MKTPLADCCHDNVRLSCRQWHRQHAWLISVYTRNIAGSVIDMSLVFVLSHPCYNLQVLYEMEPVRKP